MTTILGQPLTNFSGEAVGTNDEMRSRRFSFSSALRRVSRLRSWPHSIAVLGHPSSIFQCTPRDTPLPEHFRGVDRIHFTLLAPGMLLLARSTLQQHRSSSLDWESSLRLQRASSLLKTRTQMTPLPVPPIPTAIAQRHHRRISQEQASTM